MFPPFFLYVPLTTDAIDAINAAAGGYFSIGGTLAPNGSSPIPEPGSVGLLASGLFGAGL